MERHASAEVHNASKAGDLHCVSSSEIASEHGGNNRLHMAARFGCEELVKRIINDSPSLLCYQNKKGDNPLHVAARAGHLPIVKLLTDSFQQFQKSSQGYPIWRTQNNEGNTALHEALLSKHEEVALHLLDLDGEVIILYVNAKGASPLYLAARAGFACVLIKILLAGGGENIVGPSGQTPLHASVFAGSTENIEVLHDWLPGLTKKQDSDGKTTLYHAIEQEENSSDQIVRLLLELDASSANICDNEGLSPLLVAAKTGNLKAVRAIVEACKTLVECSDNSGCNASSAFAGGRENIEVIHDWIPGLPKEQDSDGKTALHYAIEQEENSSDQIVVPLLLELDASSADIRDKEGLSPLLVAAKTGNLEAVQAILKACPTSVGHSDYSGRNALHLALDTDIVARHSNIHFYQKLLEMPEMKALETKPDKEGNTPQLLASKLKLSLLFKEVSSIDGEDKKAKKPTRWNPRLSLYKWGIWNIYGFADRRKQAHGSEKEDLKKKMGQLSVVASLLATITFAAAFTIPGGYKADDGSPLLLHKPALQVFLLSDAIAFFISISAVMTATGSTRLSMFGRVLFLVDQALDAAIIAFISGLYAMISLKLKWMAILICVIGFCIRTSELWCPTDDAKKFHKTMKRILALKKEANRLQKEIEKKEKKQIDGNRSPPFSV